MEEAAIAAEEAAVAADVAGRFYPLIYDLLSESLGQPDQGTRSESARQTRAIQPGRFSDVCGKDGGLYVAK